MRRARYEQVVVYFRDAGSAIAPIVVPLVPAATNNNWTVNMFVFAAAYFLGAVCWGFINSDERLHD